MRQREEKEIEGADEEDNDNEKVVKDALRNGGARGKRDNKTGRETRNDKAESRRAR